MNKRQLGKNRKKLALKLLSQIEKSVGTINYCKFHSSYFVFDLPRNSVCHFTIKEIPDWYFGFWINVDRKLPKIYLLGDVFGYENKFKPLHTCITFMVEDTIIPEYIITDLINMKKDGYGRFSEYKLHHDEVQVRNELSKQLDRDIMDLTDDLVDSFNKQHTDCSLKFIIAESDIWGKKYCIKFISNQNNQKQEDEAREYFQKVIQTKQEELFEIRQEEHPDCLLKNELYSYNYKFIGISDDIFFL